MSRDEITEEIREIRHLLAARLENDVDRIGDDLRRRESASGRRIAGLPKHHPRPTVTTDAASLPRGDSSDPSVGHPNSA